MRSSHLISVAASLLLLSACALSVEHEERGARISDLEVQVDQWAQEALDEGAVAGISVAVEHDGEILVAKGYGMADLEQDVAASKNTVYRIGSITKQFTAAAIMQLVEAGQVRLDAPIQEYVDFPTGDHEVTVEQLLHHTSGIKSYTSLGEEWTRTVPLDVTHEELLGLVVDEPFDFGPGDEWRYNNSGYYLLGVIVENVTDGTYPDYVEQTLAAPLGLERTTYCDEKRLIPGRAEGYELEDGELVNDDPISMTQPFAAGSMCSTVLDLLHWQAALESGEVVSPESYARMTTEGTLNDGEATGYGYGLRVGDLDGHLRVSHGGGINGFVTHLASYPDDDLRVVVLTNTPGPTVGRLSEWIAREALGLPIVEIKDLPIDEAAAAPYLGTYDLGAVQLIVTYDGEHLVGEFVGQSTARLRYQGDHVFVSNIDDGIRVEFTVEGDAATGLNLTQGGETTEAPRVGQ